MSSNAQNYQCLQNGITHYFINSNGYLRASHIDSVNTYPDSVVYYPYRTPRGPYTSTSVPLTGLDPLGGSWMGKKVTQLNDGTFIFDNYWSDSTLVIKSQANPWETWTMYKDTGSLYYDAVVIGIDTMTVSGMLDSVKTIIITAQNATGMVTTDSLNGFHILLSKNNGFVQAFDLYMFPYHKPDSAFRQGSDFFMDRATVYPNEINGNFGYTPQKRYAIFTLTDFIIPNDEELHSNWATGDIFEWRYWYGSGPYAYPESFTSDTIVSKVTSVHDVSYTISGLHCSETNDFSFVKADTLFSDAIYRIAQPSFLPESKLDEGSYIFYYPGDETYCLKSPF